MIYATIIGTTQLDTRDGRRISPCRTPLLAIAVATDSGDNYSGCS